MIQGFGYNGAHPPKDNQPHINFWNYFSGQIPMTNDPELNGKYRAPSQGLCEGC